MSEKHFRLVFAGEVANDTDVATVQAAMAEKFKLPEAQVAALFGGRRAVLKKTDAKAPSASAGFCTDRCFGHRGTDEWFRGCIRPAASTARWWSGVRTQR